MHILVSCFFRAGRQKAYAINTVKMAHGFAQLGHDVTIICYQSYEGKVEENELALIYGLTKPLNWVQIPNKILGRYITRERAALLTCLWVMRNKPDLVFGRGKLVPLICSKFGISSISEEHSAEEITYFSRLLRVTNYRKILAWITISQSLADIYSLLKIPLEKVLVLSNAVDFELYEKPKNLPSTPYQSKSFNVSYVGHLYDYKGIPTVLESAKLLPDITFNFVGGWPDDIERQQKLALKLKLKNVYFHGLKKQIDIPKYLWHSDLLLLPNSLNHPSAKWTSPVKLGEYFASGTPVIATRIPALADQVTDDEVEFVEPDSPNSLAKGILRVLENRQRYESLREFGLKKSQELTYRKRAEIILDFCNMR